MKKLLALIVVCGAILFALGKDDAQYVKHEAYYTVKSSDSVKSIAWRGWKLDQRRIEWNEYLVEFWTKHNTLVVDEKPIKPGDVVRIVWYEVKK